MPLEQSAANSITKNGPGDTGSTTVRATFGAPTTAGRTVLVVATTAGGVDMPHALSVSGYPLLGSISIGDLQLTVWARENAPAVSSIAVSVSAYRSMQVRLLELSGVAQASAVDRVTRLSGESSRAYTGASGTTARADEHVIAIIANQYATTTQAGFTGGMARLFESVSPSNDEDWERSRTTIHQLITSATGSFALSAALSTSRRWIGFLVTFRGGTVGPLKLSSTTAPPVLTTSGLGRLTVFGPLRSTTAPPVLTTRGVRARIGPFDFQYRLGGWDGLLIGQGTPYRVESVEGLEGWEVRTSDTEQPRGDGALRGVDLQGARLVQFKLNFDGTPAGIEQARELLYRSLVPQRDTDWELIWRHPGQPLKSLFCRPVSVARELNVRQTILASQTFNLRSADPRHYSAQIHNVIVPTTQVAAAPARVQAVNLGNGFAYPIIRLVTGPTSPDPASRVVLTNVTTDTQFDVASVLPRGAALVGDMPAYATGAPRSVVTIDDQSRYGSWQHPRRPFALAPGLNVLQFQVEPAGALVSCALEYRSTWTG